jgi:hypothetical protein
MRAKISTLFGFYLSPEESILSYMNRMDKAGQLDQFKIIKLLAIVLEEIELLSSKKSSPK